MTDVDVVEVAGYADLASDRDLHGDDPDVVARALREASGGDLVAWLPDWLVREKDLDPLPRSENIVAGAIDHETDAAYLLLNGQQKAWLPKSVIRVYRASPDADLDIPQHGLTDYANGGVQS